MNTEIGHSMKCGYCETGTHDRCPSAVRIKDDAVFQCACGCAMSRLMRCTECNNRRQEEIGDDWRCTDRDACAADLERRVSQNPIVAKIRSIKQGLAHTRSLELAERRATQRIQQGHEPEHDTTPAPVFTKAAPARARREPASPRDCTCGCGGQTKGGMFLPGHDSKYLTILAGMGHMEAVALAARVSPAFESKLTRRLIREKKK